jgi:hypothetical protein
VNGPNFRRRQLDLFKPIALIPDINEVFKKDDNPALNWVSNSQNDPKALGDQEIKRILDLFDKKKNIVIPKSENIEKKDNQSGQNGEGKFTINENYKQTKFERPRHYIVHSQKNHLEPKMKDYEANIHDMAFLKFENACTLEELEKIITDLENDINKGEMIPTERIKDIISKYVSSPSNIDKICKVSSRLSPNHFILYQLTIIYFIVLAC